MSNFDLTQAAQKGDAAAVHRLLDQNADVNQADGEGRTALYNASLNGNAAIVQRLLKRSANPNLAKTSNGWTPLIRAAAEGHVAIVQALLEHKADINQADKEGLTALLIAARRHKIDVARILLHKGCAEATDAALRTKAIAEAQHVHCNVNPENRQAVVTLLANWATLSTQPSPTKSPTQPSPTKSPRPVVKVQTPNVQPAGGAYFAPLEVSLSSETSASVIYYTLNGDMPTTHSDVYSAPFTISAVVHS